jgi:nicotinamide mononucleotide transporter
VSGVVAVWLTTREKVWCWPTGLLNVGLSALVFLHSRLYGSAALQLVYVALCLYGWYQWLHGGVGEGRLEVSRTPRRWLGGLGLVGTAFAFGLGLFLRYRTDAALPFWDASMTAFSLVAQWMTTRKWIENWLVWIPVDGVYVAMYLSQRLYAYAGLYAVFLVLALLGYREWRRSLGAAVVAEVVA